MRGTLTDAQHERWETIKKSYQRVQTQGGKDSDPVTRVVGQLTGIGQQLEAIQEGIRQAAARQSEALKALDRRILDEGTSIRRQIRPLKQPLGSE